MFVHNTIRKEISCNENGFILCDVMGINTISFFAELPKTAVVDHIKVNGKYLEDIAANKSLVPNMDEYETIKHNGVVCKCAMTVNFTDELPELYGEAASYEIEKFEVYYHHEAVIDAD